MDFVTIRDVELCSAGMEWPSAGGPVTLTLEHIADAVRAGEDTLITPPRLKIGHSDPRFADPEDPGHDPFYDGEPAFGSVANLRLGNDGAVAIGDYINVPAWLAGVLPSAFPSRSIEGAYSIQEGPGGKMEARWDVETPAGRHYSFVLTACALLGVQAPAVKDIEDLQFRMTEGEGVIVTGDPEAGGVPVAVSMGAVKSTMTLKQAPAETVALAGGEAVSLEADVDSVIDAFYSEYATMEADRYWWWVRSVRVDPNTLIVDDDEGSLWSVEVSTDSDQNVTFGNPERVIQTFQPAPEAAAALAAAAQSAPRGGRTLKAFAAREQTVPSDRKDKPAGGGSSASASISGMDFSELSPKQRTRLTASLDLAEDASDEQIEKALDEDVPEGAPEGDGGSEGEGNPEGGDGSEGDGAPADGDEGDGDGTGDEAEGGQNPPAASGDSPTVTVDKTALAELQAKADRGDKAFAQLAEQARERILRQALSDGKITPASKGDWAKKLEAAPKATEAELDGLAKNLVPVDEVGHGGSDATGTGVAVSADDMGAMFPGHGKAA